MFVRTLFLRGLCLNGKICPSLLNFQTMSMDLAMLQTIILRIATGFAKSMSFNCTLFFRALDGDYVPSNPPFYFCTKIL